MPSDNSQVFVSEITAFAKEIGLYRVGFDPASPPDRAEEFRKWLDAGQAGTMSWLHRSAARRLDPRRVLLGARTLIVAAEPYFTERLPEEIRNDPSRGLIASYAWGEDYHEVLLDKLVRLAEFIEKLAVGTKTRSYVDTGHVLERAHAARAGFGFIGQNTMLILPGGGSRYFLGEILTTLELPPSQPPRLPSCGTCTRCLTACPTGALVEPFVLDSNLCISYLTIEFRGVIPRELRPLMGNHVFGCDDCQDCCPWNLRFSAPTEEEKYRGKPNRQAPKLADLAAMSEADFRDFFAKSAVLRAKHAGFMRNVAIALGNWGSGEALPPLEKLLRHPDPLVRAHAVWAVSKVDHPGAVKLTKQIKDNESDERVRNEL